jgi:hypothetical protein
MSAPEEEREIRDANAMLRAGAGIGAIGAFGLVAFGAVCPVCVVAAPVLLGVGAVRRWRGRRQRSPDAPNARTNA